MKRAWISITILFPGCLLVVQASVVGVDDNDDPERGDELFGSQGFAPVIRNELLAMSVHPKDGETVVQLYLTPSRRRTMELCLRFHIVIMRTWRHLWER